MKKEAMLYEPLDKEVVHCFLCAHECRIAPSKFGICGVRQNLEGKLYTLVYGEPIAAHMDPIEKKPLYHFLPGTYSFSVATVGCNFRCQFCQNWQISQLNKKDKRADGIPEVSCEEVVEHALRHHARSISYTYTEPTIFFEYAYDIARLAKKENLFNVFVTNGYMTPQALETIQPYLDCANVDLKSFRDDYYKNICSARLKPVLDTIRHMRRLNIWIEVTTLIVPGVNDSDEELGQIAGFIAGVDPDIPWHVSRFHPDYQFTEYPATPPETLHRARTIGKARGLHHIYLGNVLEGTDTLCYKCNTLLVKRSYMNTKSIYLKNGACPNCHAPVQGIWEVGHEE